MIFSEFKNSKEFITNKDPQTPTNKICTSLLQKKRIEFLLRFGIAYVSTKKGIEKHIMRYPQIFAAQQIKNKIDKGINKGVIWHTQGSGKTALAYYSLKYLLNYFRSKKKISKYYKKQNSKIKYFYIQNKKENSNAL